jgi:hypothetical protein
LRTLGAIVAALVAIPLAILALWLAFLALAPSTACHLLYSNDVEKARGTVEAVEAFRLAHGRLPNPDDHHEISALKLRAGYFVDAHGDYEVLVLGFDGPVIGYRHKDKHWRCEL